MPDLIANGHRIHYRVDGPAAAPVLVLSNSLGTTLDMWEPQVGPLSQCVRLLRYDTRGHGRSETTPGEYSVELLGTDVLSLAAGLGIAEFAFCGISMGGLIGQWLALHAGTRLTRVVLCNTAAKIGDVAGWNERITATRHGMASLAQAAVARWFTPEFAAAQPVCVDTLRRQMSQCNPAAYAANCAAVRDADFRADLGTITHPVLVLAGRHDPVTTLAAGESLAAAIPAARLAIMDAAHLSNLGDAQRFNSAVADFLGVAAGAAPV